MMLSSLPYCSLRTDARKGANFLYSGLYNGSNLLELLCQSGIILVTWTWPYACLNSESKVYNSWNCRDWRSSPSPLFPFVARVVVVVVAVVLLLLVLVVSHVKCIDFNHHIVPHSIPLMIYYPLLFTTSLLLHHL